MPLAAFQQTHHSIQSQLLCKKMCECVEYEKKVNLYIYSLYEELFPVIDNDHLQKPLTTVGTVYIKTHLSQPITSMKCMQHCF